MYQDSTSKWWHPVIITSLCQEKWSYKIKTKDGFIYRNTQAHLKPYIQKKMAQPNNQQPMAQPIHKQPMAKSDHNAPQVKTSRPKRDTKAPVKLDL